MRRGGTNEGDLELGLGCGGQGADGVEVLDGADACLAVQEVVHLHVQAGQRRAHAVVVRARAKNHTGACAPHSCSMSQK